MTQLSLLPDEVPDEKLAPKKKRRHSLRARIRKIIRVEGLYKYALMAQDCLRQSDTYIEDKYKMSREELKTILYSEFGFVCSYQENIDSYLHKVNTIPGFALKYKYDDDEDSHSEIR